MLHILNKTPVQLALLGALSSHVLRSAAHDYEQRGRLSTKTSAAAWVLYLFHATLTVSAAARSRKRAPVGQDPAFLLGSITTVSGSALLAAGIQEFRSFGQVSGSETGQLVESGSYRYSRNPQIVGWLISLLSISIAGRSPKSLALSGFFFVVHRLYFPVEERHLERTSGEKYQQYRSKTPRFLGFPNA